MTSHRDNYYSNSFRDNGTDCSPIRNKLWVIINHVTAKNLTKVLRGTSDQVGLAIKDMQKSLSSLAT
jgi:hypothetical protein